MSVAIIGAGPSGLVAAKEALECGLEPTVFEKGDAIGGLWKPKSGSVWDSLQTNLSHHTCMFSDFPWKEDIQDFPNQAEVHQYLCDYADAFKIHPHVRLHSEVKKLERASEKWSVEWLDEELQPQCAEFNYLIVCSGIFSKTFTPSIPGLDTFPGPVIHSDDYRTPQLFEGKTVVIIGSAYSACEIAAEITQTAEKVINVIHRPMWILPHYLPKATTGQHLPLDLIFYSRASQARYDGVEPTVVYERKNSWFATVCSRQAQICPDLAVTAPLSSPPFAVISDSYPDQIEAGKITVKTGSITEVNSDTLFMEKGDTVKADALIFCTGYRADIPFFDEDAKKLLEFDADDPLQPFLMYKTVFHPEFPNLAFVGMYRSPFFGTVELQARMACLTFSRKIPVPTSTTMIEGIKEEKEIRDAFPRPQFPHGSYVQFSDDLAKCIGALPDFEELKESNRVLHDQLWNGAYTPASFRLTGIGNKPEVAMNIIERINKATQSG